MLSLIVTWPLASMIGAAGALFLLRAIWVSQEARRLCLALLMLMPFAPIFAVRLACVLVIWCCDALVRRFRMARAAAAYLEQKFSAPPGWRH